jgi:hypothetical protein
LAQKATKNAPFSEENGAVSLQSEESGKAITAL